MKREIKFRAWHKETKQMLNIWPYEWIKGSYAGTGKSNEFFNNEFQISEDGNSCDRVTGKSVFMTLDGQIIGVVPIGDKATQSVNYSDEYDIMQFTGLKDKNGKEIYEGDFLKLIDEYRGKGERPVYVIWEDSQWMMQGTMHYSHKDFIGNYSLDKMEVIGNIYENPELIQ